MHGTTMKIPVTCTDLTSHLYVDMVKYRNRKDSKLYGI